jgi:hypothetical protein
MDPIRHQQQQVIGNDNKSNFPVSDNDNKSKTLAGKKSSIKKGNGNKKYNGSKEKYELFRRETGRTNRKISCTSD